MIKNYFSLVKFSHTIFAMPFAILGFFIAASQVEQLNWRIFLLVLLCMVFARNAAMAFNRYLDRDIDSKNIRTASREIPSGLISSKSALLFVIINSILLVITTWFMNKLVFFLSPVALLIILGYSYTKRFTSLCHLVLGLGLALAPTGAYLALIPEWNLTVVLISFSVLFWTAGFDIIYSLQDENFDSQNKLHSIPALLGREKSLSLSLVFHIITSILLIITGFVSEFSNIYWIACSTFSLLLFYQHLIVKPNDISRVNLAFFTLNGIASLIFGTISILSLYF